MFTTFILSKVVGFNFPLKSMEAECVWRTGGSGSPQSYVPKHYKGLMERGYYS